MYIVTIQNNGEKTQIHGKTEKLASGSVVKGINSIDSFSFSILPTNAGFNLLNDFKTLVSVYNTTKQRYEFYGRVLYSSTQMSESGMITKDVTCESYFGYLCDTQQIYVAERNWTVRGLLEHILSVHNGQVDSEAEKHFKVGYITVSDPNDNVYIGIQRENTWETISKKLIETLGGEIRFRVEKDGLYLDYLEKIGETKTTAIALSKNMKAITREQNPTEIITRLIPLGAKVSDSSEERLDISEVNDGQIYLDDAEAIEKYGIHVGYVEYDDVTEAENLKARGLAWLEANNKVQVKYSVTALDLSLLGLDIDDFDVCNYYPLKNRLLLIDDVARVIKKTIDICEEVKSTIEVGDNLKSLSELQSETASAVKAAANSISAVVSKTSASTQKLENQLAETTEKYDEQLAAWEQQVADLSARLIQLEGAVAGHETRIAALEGGSE